MKRMSCTLTRLCLLHHSIPGIMLLFGIITHHASGIFVLNVTVPLRESPVRANCTIPGSADNEIIIFNISTIFPDLVLCNPHLRKCIPSSYPKTGPVFYTFWTGSNSAWIDILSLDRIRDQSVWRCSSTNYPTLGTINLTVFTSPKGVKYVQPIPPDRDLGQESVTLICETDNCVYPARQISWYYLNNQQEKVRYNVSDGGMVNNISTCDQLEEMYTSTLHLTRGTTFQGNIDFRTKFACGVQHPTLDVDIYFSEFSNYVTFAVSVTEITLESSTAGTFVFYDGFSQNLKCTSSPSRPSPTIKWMLESQTESVELTDNITNTDVTNVDGLYVRTSEITLTLKKENRYCKIFCSGNIDGQQIAALSSKVTIDVWYMPNKPEVQEYGTYFPWFENHSGTLICNSSNYGNPTSNVSWTSNKGITDAKGHLVIKGLAWSDHRNMVSCQLVNRYTIDKDVHAVSESINLNVEYSPRIQFNTTSPLTVNETQFLSVSCNATGNPNPNQIFWSVRRDPDGSLLRFENISRNDNGTYMCNATANSAKYGTLRNQMEFNIIVQYAPVMNVTNVTSTLQDTTCLITCEAIGFPAVYTFHPWKHMWGETTIRSNLKGIPTGSTSTSQNILKLERLSLQDMGTYVCSAENRIKGINGEFNQTAAVDLNILGVPAFLSEENKKFAGGIGLFINVSIPFYSYSNVTSFMFKRNGIAVMNTSRINTHLRSSVIDYKLHDRNIQLRAQEAYLYIQNLTQEDFDNYTLILENPQGPAEFIVTLDPLGPPLMVLRFYLNRVGDQIELHFDPGFNGGRIQEFVIQYKSETSLEDWKNASILQETKTQYRLPNGTFAVNITKPSPGSYIYRMYSWNEIDSSPYSLEIRVFIPEGIKPPQDSSQVAAIAGGIGAAVLVIALATIVIVMIKRRNQSSDETSRREIKERTESGLIDNPVYDTSDNMPSPSTSTSAVGTEYAVVVKSKHDQKVAKTEDPSNVYAQVEKKKMKTNKNGASKGKLGKAARGDIYENATIVKGSTNRDNVYENPKSVKLDSSSEDMYENPAATSGKDRRVNKDDLHYADVMLAAPTTKAGKPVIHGLENRTEYAEIAYGKRGKPLPESEHEEESGCPEKDNKYNV